MAYSPHRLGQARTALAAVRQCPISNRFAIHNHVIAVSDRNLAAIRAFFMSPFGRRFNSSSFQPAARNIAPTNRSAFCSSDSFNSFTPHSPSTRSTRSHGERLPGRFKYSGQLLQR